jgi:hypothetical protein
VPLLATAQGTGWSILDAGYTPFLVNIPRRFTARNLKREEELLSEAAQWCQQYTSVVSIETPDELLLEVRGSFRLFGGLPLLLSRIESDLNRRGLCAQIAVSPTPESALWIARGACTARTVPPAALRAALSSLPLCTLRWPLDIELRLIRFGVRSIGDLLRLPRSGLARRIGAVRVRELDQATGRAPSLRKAVHTQERYSRRAVLDFEIAADQLGELVPIENASMEGRTMIQWDKDDLESLGLLKVDVLALGIMTAIRKTLDLHNHWHGTTLTFATIPAEDPETYQMIQKADTVGVFQIESRAQMSMLPRLTARIIRSCSMLTIYSASSVLRTHPPSA